MLDEKDSRISFRLLETIVYEDHRERRHDMNLANNLESSAIYFPERPAIRQGDLEWTYGELNERANKIATGLVKLGIKPGDFVGLCSTNSADWIAFYYGALKAGAVTATLSSLLTGDELAYLINHAKPRVLFTEPSKLKDVAKLKSADVFRRSYAPMETWTSLSSWSKDQEGHSARLRGIALILLPSSIQEELRVYRRASC